MATAEERGMLEWLRTEVLRLRDEVEQLREEITQAKKQKAMAEVQKRMLEKTEKDFIVKTSGQWAENERLKREVLNLTPADY